MEQIPVLYDHQAFEMQRYGGISRYFYELMIHIKRPFSIALSSSANFYVNQDKTLDSGYAMPLRVHKLFKKQFVALNRRNSVKQLKNRSPYLFHPTYYNPYFLEYIGKNPYVVTVHDMNHELMPECFRDAPVVTARKKVILERAARIIAISENTKKDIIRLFSTDPKIIEVIYHGTSAEKSNLNRLQLPDNYILFVGNRGGYKNFDRLLTAFRQLAMEDPTLQLICTGKPFTKSEYLYFKEIHLQERICNIMATDEELSQLYNNARLFIFPSLYEGFGIPILEAYVNECPVALSNTSCFPEIAGNAGVFFDPFDPESIGESIHKVLTNGILRDKLITDGLHRLKKYSWEKTAKKTEAVYDSVLSNLSL